MDSEHETLFTTYRRYLPCLLLCGQSLLVCAAAISVMEGVWGGKNGAATVPHPCHRFYSPLW